MVARKVKVPLHIVEERRRQLAAWLQQHAYAPLQDVCARFEISAATARRDLAALAAQKQIVRTYGGALTEYHQRFPTFRERESAHAPAKRRIAAAARDLIEPGSTCFLDLGTTIFALAELLRRRPVADLRIVTNSLPVAELLSPVAPIRVFLLGGEVMPRQSALSGAVAGKTLRFYSIDQAFFGAEAANKAGVWNSHDELTAFQQRALKQSARNILCLDRTKLGHTAPSFLAPWTHFDLLLTDKPGGVTRGWAACRKRLV